MNGLFLHYKKGSLWREENSMSHKSDSFSLFFLYYRVLIMSRTRTYLRRECTKCFICGYVPDKKAKKKTKEKELLFISIYFIRIRKKHSNLAHFDTTKIKKR